MDESKKITAEEKLLHLIENSTAEEKTSPGNPSKKPENPGKKNDPFPLSQVKIADLFSKINFKKMNLVATNKVLLGIAIILTVLLAVHLTKKVNLIQTRFDVLQTKGIEKEPLQLDITRGNIPDLSRYLSKTTRNNPFHVLPFVEKIQPKKPKRDIELKLVGILWADKPQAIVEDKTSETTHLVYEGDTLYRYTVDKITQTEVKLTSEEGDEILK